ncbi:MAG: SDR family NAD(P)-dependent oxidoreductase [Kofleriaceae bacterium]|nr:SDR family NAD(P)-dependent oxidoreductase [Kofleriaceae bacterium]
MTKTIIVGGYGPGISNAVAERFGKEGFTVAIVARNADRLAAGVKSLQAKGVRAEAFVADLSQPDQIRSLIPNVRAKLGPISVLQWTAYSNLAGDLTTATTAEIRGCFDVAIAGLHAAIQESLPDLRAQKGAILVTNGGLGFFDPQVDKGGVLGNVMGLSMANSAKHKLVRLLAEKLRPDGVYVGEVVVTDIVKGTAFDPGNGKLEASTIAGKFWDLYQARKDTHAVI